MDKRLERLSFENKACVKIVIKKEELKKHLLELKTNFKKLMDNFFNKNFNTSFGILTLMSYFLLLKVALYEANPNIETDLIITADEENFYVRFVFLKFYNRDLTKYNGEQVEVLINTQLQEEEIEVLASYIDSIVTEETIREKINIFVDLSFNIDSFIKEMKEKVEKKEITMKTFNFEMLKHYFNVYALVALNDQLSQEKEYMENEYGKN